MVELIIKFTNTGRKMWEQKNELGFRLIELEMTVEPPTSSETNHKSVAGLCQ